MCQVGLLLVHQFWADFVAAARVRHHVSRCSFRLSVTLPAVLIKSLISTKKLSVAVFVSVTAGSLFGALGSLYRRFPLLCVSAVCVVWRLTELNKRLYYFQFSCTTGAAEDENKPFCSLTTFLAYKTRLNSHGFQALV